MSFHELNIKSVRVADPPLSPAIISPLMDAAACGGDLVSAVTKIVTALGFDTVMYGLSTEVRPGHDSYIYFFTTVSQQWVKRYQQEAYIEVDPRVEAVLSSTLPYVWDQSIERGKSERLDKFIDDAATHGIRSGVSFILPDSRRASVMLALNSSMPRVNEQRRQMLVASFGTMLTFGRYFHELFMRKVVDAGMPSVLEGAPLSRREKECLTLAASGLTTEDIAERLGIKPRTAQFHFDSIRTKLAVATRNEAIARAVNQRLIRVTR
ncbi:MAG TPA: LuxR family transcriptional regulator [Casimicrobiaceae bacterium]|nr:LuxR family transcriptional regulator [Casimicrobiaceae bacterium]